MRTRKDVLLKSERLSLETLDLSSACMLSKGGMVFLSSSLMICQPYAVRTGCEYSPGFLIAKAAASNSAPFVLCRKQAAHHCSLPSPGHRNIYWPGLRI